MRRLNLHYLLLVGLVIVIDRMTKLYALHFFGIPKQITPFLDFHLVFNRGVSWGLFHSDQQTIFMWISIIIAFVIAALAFYTYVLWMNYQSIVGELLILAGAVSNLYDRMMYQGVIDFIHLSADSWHWPVFNVADMAIVLGVCIVIYQQYGTS